MAQETYARPISHVGLTVRDVEDAIRWYSDVLGFELIGPPYTVTSGDGAEFDQVSSILDVEFERLTIAHMTTTNDVGLELFAFDESPTGPTSPISTGYNHVGVVDPDIEDLARRIERNGGSQLSEISERSPGGPKVTYCADPWDNRIEIYTVNHRRFLAALGRE